MKTTFGLEIHASLKTKAKLFSTSDNLGNIDEPNAHVSQLDAGLPGILPVLNPEAVQFAVRTCLALGMRVPDVFTFDRKSYMYPDLPLGYQITQFYKPIGTDGHLPIYVGDVKRNIRIRQVHMETDAGKSIHQSDYTLLDFNRCGSPLLEIVTQPDFSTADEVIFFVRMLRATLKHINVSDANMELGDFRVDLNISVSNTDELGTRVEIKNLNSFRSIRRAIESEYNRQVDLIKSGERVRQETRGFDEKTGKTIFMRSKETEFDYMYFPEPDLPTFRLDDDVVIAQQMYMDGLPHVVLERLQKKFGVREGMVNLVEEPFVSRFVQASLEGLNPDEQKQVLKLIFGELFARLKEDSTIPISYTNFRKLAKLVLQEQLNATVIKTIMDEMWDSNDDPYSIMKDKGMEQIRDVDKVRGYVKAALSENPNELEKYKAGKTNLRAFFIGQVMKKTGSRANAAVLNKVLDEELAS